MADFALQQKILFRHCDPAGIVFYPRYFEMMNDTVEALFEDALNWPFEDMHRDSGVPTAAINVEFQAPSRLGDLLEFGLTLEKLGRTSLSLRTVATAGPETRLTATQTLVCIDQSGRPKPWPDPVRNKILSLMEGRL